MAAIYPAEEENSIGGRTALITGASAGIGKAFAEIFAAKGWNVVLAARRFDRLEVLAAELAGKYKIAASPIQADLANPDGVTRLTGEIAGRNLIIDGLVNNAGYGVPGYYVSTLWR